MLRLINLSATWEMALYRTALPGTQFCDAPKLALSEALSERTAESGERSLAHDQFFPNYFGNFSVLVVSSLSSHLSQSRARLTVATPDNMASKYAGEDSDTEDDAKFSGAESKDSEAGGGQAADDKASSPYACPLCTHRRRQIRPRNVFLWL
jgi:hypothetical protein